MALTKFGHKNVINATNFKILVSQETWISWLLNDGSGAAFGAMRGKLQPNQMNVWIVIVFIA